MNRLKEYFLALCNIPTLKSRPSDAEYGIRRDFVQLLEESGYEHLMNINDLGFTAQRFTNIWRGNLKLFKKRASMNLILWLDLMLSETGQVATDNNYYHSFYFLGESEEEKEQVKQRLEERIPQIERKYHPLYSEETDDEACVSSILEIKRYYRTPVI